MSDARPVVVIGAGLAGLTCARQLAAEGESVLVLDKGRSPGGRLATRRIGQAVVDHGAQFFTVREAEFASMVTSWQRAGLVYEWSRGFTEPADGHPRYAVRWGMNALAKHLAAGIALRVGVEVTSIRVADDGDGFVVEVDGDERSAGRDAVPTRSWSVQAKSVVLTSPVPQSLELLDRGSVQLPSADEAALRSIRYSPTIAALIVLDGLSAIEMPGGIQIDDPESPIVWIADNLVKGVSTVPALTVHASGSWSVEHYDEDEDKTLAQLIEFSAHHFGGSRIVEAQLKQWRYSVPDSVQDQRVRDVTIAAGRLLFAGDAFGGPRIEGAALSGAAAARVLLA